MSSFSYNQIKILVCVDLITKGREQHLQNSSDFELLSIRGAPTRFALFLIYFIIKIF